MKIIYRLLRHLPNDIDYRIVFLERDLVEVFESQQDMLLSKNDPAALQDRERLLSALSAELVKAKQWLSHCANMQILTVPYADVIANPAKWSHKISRFLDGLDESVMAAAVDPALYRHTRR